VLSNLDAAAAEREPSPTLKSQILRRLVPDRDRAPAAAQPGRDLQFIRRTRLALPLAAVVALVLALGYLLGRQAALDQELISVPLQGDTGGGSASVTVRRSGATEIALRGLPDPPPGHVYQAWVVAGDGVRRAAAAYDDGNGTFPLSRSALGKGVEVTIETEPGADTPTTQPLLWGRASP
jgi:anti-sigma-K factor RskA